MKTCCVCNKTITVSASVVYGKSENFPLCQECTNKLKDGMEIRKKINKIIKK